MSLWGLGPFEHVTCSVEELQAIVGANEIFALGANGAPTTIGKTVSLVV